MNKKEIEDLVYNYKSKYEEGLVYSEIAEIKQTVKEKVPNFNEERFEDATTGITCTMKNKEIVIYKRDVVTGLLCGAQNRGLTPTEFD